MRLHALPGMSWVEDLRGLDGGDPSCVPSKQPPPTVATLDFDGVRAALAPPTPLTAAEVEAYSNTHSPNDEAKAAKLKARRHLFGPLSTHQTLDPCRPYRPTCYNTHTCVPRHRAAFFSKARGACELLTSKRARQKYAHAVDDAVDAHEADVDGAVDALREVLASRPPKKERAVQGENSTCSVERNAPFAEWVDQLGIGHKAPPSQKELAAAKAAAARRRAAKMLERQNKAAELRKAEEREAANRKETRAVHTPRRLRCATTPLDSTRRSDQSVAYTVLSASAQSAHAHMLTCSRTPATPTPTPRDHRSARSARRRRRTCR